MFKSENLNKTVNVGPPCSGHNYRQVGQLSGATHQVRILFLKVLIILPNSLIVCRL